MLFPLLFRVSLDCVVIGVEGHLGVYGYDEPAGAPERLFGKLLPLDPNRRESIALTRMGPREARFYAEYSSLQLSGENLWQIMESERLTKYRQAVLNQMRLDAGAANGKWEIPDDVRKRIEGRESGSEE